MSTVRAGELLPGDIISQPQHGEGYVSTVESVEWLTPTVVEVVTVDGEILTYSPVEHLTVTRPDLDRFWMTVDGQPMCEWAVACGGVATLLVVHPHRGTMAMCATHAVSWERDALERGYDLNVWPLAAATWEA
jgi:hypothetical protein